jgi:hypothetical protein
MRKFLRALVLVCIVMALYFLVIKKWYFVETSLSPYCHVLWKENEAFIFVYTKRVGTSGTSVQLLYHAFMGIFDLPHLDANSDALVFHIKDGDRDDSRLNSVEDNGTTFPLNGKIYYYGHSKDGEQVWFWTGTAFERLAKDDGKKLMHKFELFDDVIKKEGWKEVELPESPTENTVEMSIGSRRMKLVEELPEIGGRQGIKVSLEGRTNGASSEVLAEMMDKSRNVSKSEYRRAFE